MTTPTQTKERINSVYARGPESKLPSKCVATCDGCHESPDKHNPHQHWVTAVEERYCDGDHSDDDFGFVGWEKKGDMWYPALWPPAHSPGLTYKLDRLDHTLTEGY